MKILNLIYPDKSDIKYKISKFPDGQQQITIESFKFTDIWISTQLHLLKDCEIQIKSRLNNFKDLELIICTLKSLRGLDIKYISLYTPYFLGSRSDRQFEEGSNNYLKQVICPIINSLNFESVTVIDPHSDVLEACLNNFKRVTNRELIEFSLCNLNLKTNEFILVSPDAGASKKIYKLAEQIGYKGDIITCSKDRDNDGKLTKTVVPLDERMFKTMKDVIIIDDICDGGATFINIAKEIKSFFDHPSLKWETKPKIYLIVTHGIFSKDFDDLSKYFDGIFCTNSYKDLENWTIDFGIVSSSRQIKFVNEKIKQLNVF